MPATDLSRGALTGLRVVDLSRVLAGPLCTGGTPANLAKFERQERSKWAPLIKAAGLKGD